MKRSRLKNKANRSNSQTKSGYFNKISNSESSRPFWDTFRPYCSNKHARGDSIIMLIEKDKIILKMKK